jgi:hypothetical protein
MVNLYGEWLMIILNAIIIALILTAPFLVGILVIRVLRRNITADRRSFEDEVRSKLLEISETLEEIKQKMDGA